LEPFSRVSKGKSFDISLCLLDKLTMRG